jgi:hypothetical protein
MNWNNNVIKTEVVQFPPPIVNRTKAFFPGNLCQTGLIEGEVEDRRELGKKKGLHEVNGWMMGVSFDHLIKTPVPENTWHNT